MAELKREYVVPLRRKTKLAPKWRRSKKAVSVLNEFIKKHMKTDNVVICKELNEKIWENGIKNPPGKVAVVALKKEFNGVERTLVNLADVGVEEQVKLYESQVPEIPSVGEDVSTKSQDGDESKVVDVEASEKPIEKKDEKENKGGKKE